jgi:heat shock protein HslJ
MSAGPPEKDVYFVLNSENHRVSGSGGCNRLTGGLSQGMDVEKAFLQMLGEVSTWKIAGHRLELFNARQCQPSFRASFASITRGALLGHGVEPATMGENDQQSKPKAVFIGRA